MSIYKQQLDLNNQNCLRLRTLKQHFQNHKKTWELTFQLDWCFHCKSMRLGPCKETQCICCQGFRTNQAWRLPKASIIGQTLLQVLINLLLKTLDQVLLMKAKFHSKHHSQVIIHMPFEPTCKMVCESKWNQSQKFFINGSCGMLQVSISIFYSIHL